MTASCGGTSTLEITMRHCDLLLSASLILTQNEQREILENSSLAIANGRIVDIGESAEIISRWQAEESIDLGESLLMPGLVNAHAHSSMTFLRGVADDQPLMRWLEKSVFPVEARLNPEICRLGALLGYAEMLATGVTACIDMYIFEDAVFEAADNAGIRCLGGEAVFGFPSAASPDFRDALMRTEALADRYAGNERLKVAVNPHSVYTTDREILAACRDLAQKRDLPLHIHLAETENETALSLRRHGLRPVEYCQSLGLFENDVIAAHVVDVNEEEMDILAKNHVKAVHCPSSNMKLASGLSPVPRMREKGITVALGTDGPASNNQLNIFMEMRLAALIHKMAMKDPTVAPAGEILDMATIGGARAFGMPALGSLRPGHMADCVALDLKSVNLLPLSRPVSHIVYAATGHECRLTMVAGEILYMEGRYKRFDVAELREEVKKFGAFVAGRQ